MIKDPQTAEVAAIDYITQSDFCKSRLGLSRMKKLLAELGAPHEKLKYIHVAGTNGKGSVCAMLAAVLAEAGYKTGLYTSPYINRFNERIQINGQSIDNFDLARITRKVQIIAEQMVDHPTEFEMTTAIALQYYHEWGCDLVVLEVGLGGRLDATNIIPPPEIAVITPISMDHTAELGNTLEKIASEKGGIIRSGAFVVSSPQEPGAMSMLWKICDDKNATLEPANTDAVVKVQSDIKGQKFSFKGYKNLEISLLGSHQIQNAVVALTVIERLQKRGWSISEEHIRAGLAKTKWQARFEIVSHEPWFIVDGGHNEQGVSCLLENLSSYFPGRKIIFIIGVMADKDYKTMLGKVTPLAKRIFTVTPKNPRALDAATLAAYFQDEGMQSVKSCESVLKGAAEALAAAGKADVICAFGSFYMAGELRGMFGLK